MFLPFDQTLVDGFLRLLSEPAPPGRKKELVIQEFLEDNTALVPTPNLLNHHLHFQCFVSQFPLDAALRTDYIYLTKSSASWRITLVEIENPDKPLYTNTTRVTPSAHFTAAIAQVKEWQIFVENNREYVLKKLGPLLRPPGMASNPAEFNYQLVIGRSKEKNLSLQRKKHFQRIARDNGIDMMTYDGLLNYYTNGERYMKNVLLARRNGYEFKRLHVEPTHIFAYLGPDELYLVGDQRQWLIDRGYEIAKWEKGDMLSVNIKLAGGSLKKAFEDLGKT